MTLSVWSDEDVRLADVLDAIDGLRRPERLPPTRTSVMTLVVVASRRSNAEWARAAVHELGGRHPARLLTILPEPSSPRGMDAEVRLLGGEADGVDLWFEDVELVVRGPAAAHLDSVIEPFTLPDLPVVVWFVDQLPEPDEALLRPADAILVDARGFGDVDCFATLAALTGRVPVVDLSWVRLQPWRELLAGLFTGRDFRPFIGGVRTAQVLGRTGPRHLLGGWLTDRLRLDRGQLQLVEAEHVSIGIDAVLDGRAARFEVTREGDTRAVSARAHVLGGAQSTTVVSLPEATPAWGLAGALSRIEHDRVYERALHFALGE